MVEESKEDIPKGTQAAVVLQMQLDIKVTWQWDRVVENMTKAIDQYKNSKKQSHKDYAIANMEGVARDWAMNGADIKISKENQVQICKDNEEDFRKGGPIPCNGQCLMQGMAKQNRKWCGALQKSLQKYELGFGFYTVGKCQHGRLLKFKWFIDEKGAIHNAKDKWVDKNLEKRAKFSEKNPNKTKQELLEKFPEEMVFERNLIVKNPVNDENFRDQMEVEDKKDNKDKSHLYE